ncbi:MAG: hypothetical protein K0S12_1050 [Bacteroidetes bacterium]|nr:hypothetical protein [Bacteroidota bacterium]
MGKVTDYIGEKKTTYENSVFRYDNYSIYFYDTDSPLKAEIVGEHDAAIIDAKDFDHAKLLVKRIRSSNDPEIYLKPVFLINYKDHYDKALTELTDGTLLSFDQIPEKINDIKTIKSHILQLDKTPGKYLSGCVGELRTV